MTVHVSIRIIVGQFVHLNQLLQISLLSVIIQTSTLYAELILPYTVEPPIRDTCFNPVLILSCIVEPLNNGHLCIKDNFHGPSVSFIQRFHCILTKYNLNMCSAPIRFT